METVLDFFSSLSVVGWFVVILCVLLLLNLPGIVRGIVRLRSRLDSQEHRLWKQDRINRIPERTKGTMKLDHLERDRKG